MHSKALLGLMIILSFYALFDLLSTKKYEWISLESKMGLAFLSNILTISGLMNILQLYDLQLHFSVYIALLLALCILIQYLITYFGGFRYKIPYSDTESLSVMLKNVLWYQGYKDIEQIVEYRENKFSFPGEKKSIELELRDGIFNKTNYHYLKLKRWTNRESREAITEALDAKLERYEPNTPSEVYKTFEYIIILICIVGMIGYYNYQAIRPPELSIYDLKSPPKVLSLMDHDIDVTDPLIINSFEEQFEDIYAFYYKGLEPIFMDNTSITVGYGDPYRTLIIGPNHGYLYVDFEKLKAVSLWDNIMVSAYDLYGDKKGVYYRINSSDSFYGELTRIIQNN